MINSFKRISLHESVGLVLVIIGFIAPSFIVLRPNRIENGTGMSLYAAAGDLWSLVAVLLLALLLVVFLPYFRLMKKISSVRWYKGVSVLYNSLLIPGIVLITGQLSYEMAQGQPTAVRISLGTGFWLMIIGLVILLQEKTARFSDNNLIRLLSLSIVCGGLLMAYQLGLLSYLSIIKEYDNKSSRIGAEIIRHMQLTAAATLTGLTLSVFLAYQAYRFPKRRGMVMSFVNMAQVIPTLTLLGLIMIPLTQLSNWFPQLRSIGISGIGYVPAYICLTLYAILPITTNILAGYTSIDSRVIEAGKGMGMTMKQLHRKVELPLVIPYLFDGFSTAIVQTVGNTILAGLVGGGGMGAMLFLGLAQSAPDLVILSALMIVAIAWFLKTILSIIQPYVRRINGVST